MHQALPVGVMDCEPTVAAGDTYLDVLLADEHTKILVVIPELDGVQPQKHSKGTFLEELLSVSRSRGKLLSLKTRMPPKKNDLVYLVSALAARQVCHAVADGPVRVGLSNESAAIVGEICQHRNYAPCPRVKPCKLR